MNDNDGNNILIMFLTVQFFLLELGTLQFVFCVDFLFVTEIFPLLSTMDQSTVSSGDNFNVNN